MKKVNQNFWVIIIVFFPVREKLTKLVNSITTQNGRILLFNNGGLQSMSTLEENENLVILGNGSNKGIGFAINRSVEYIKKKNGELFFIFDQDTSISHSYCPNMISAYKTLTKNTSICALTPSVVDNRNEKYKYKNHSNVELTLEGLTYKKTIKVLLSGLLTNVQTCEKTPFNELLFIEFVEYEWGLRCSSIGLDCWALQNENILHEVSEQAPKTILGFSLLAYKPIRRYYFSRNLVFLLKQNHVPLKSKIRLFTGFLNRFFSIIFLSSERRKSFYYLMLGLKDGILNNFRNLQ